MVVAWGNCRGMSALLSSRHHCVQNAVDINGSCVGEELNHATQWGKACHIYRNCIVATIRDSSAPKRNDHKSVAQGRQKLILIWKQVLFPLCRTKYRLTQGSYTLFSAFIQEKSHLLKQSH
jgi:hypothetical protein